jgi:hypothetical protein
VDVAMKCKAIINWAVEEKDDFELGFVQSVLDQVTKAKRPASPKQEAALDNIICQFKIDVENWA